MHHLHVALCPSPGALSPSEDIILLVLTVQSLSLWIAHHSFHSGICTALSLVATLSPSAVHTIMKVSLSCPWMLGLHIWFMSSFATWFVIRPPFLPCYSKLVFRSPHTSVSLWTVILAFRNTSLVKQEFAFWREKRSLSDANQCFRTGNSGCLTHSAQGFFIPVPLAVLFVVETFPIGFTVYSVSSTFIIFAS